MLWVTGLREVVCKIPVHTHSENFISSLLCTSACSTWNV